MAFELILGPPDQPKQVPGDPTGPQVLLFSRDPVLRVSAMLDDPPPKIVGGYGGWTEIERPQRASFIHWKGRSPFRMQIALLLDGYFSNRSVEGFILNLERWALPAKEADNKPPTIYVVGAVPKSGQQLPWVIESLNWGDEVIRRKDGNRVRQSLDLRLVQRIEPQLALPSSAARAKSDVGKKTRLYTVKSGDTLTGIAARLLGRAARWTEIRDLNNIRDPKTIRAGQRLRIPAK